MTDLEKAEILRQIKDAEEKVRAAIKEAEERRKQLQAEGKRRALERFEASEASLRKELDQRISDARSRIERRKEFLLGEGTKKAEVLKSSAQKRMSTAAEFVLIEFERAVDA